MSGFSHKLFFILLIICTSIAAGFFLTYATKKKKTENSYVQSRDINTYQQEVETNGTIESKEETHSTFRQKQNYSFSKLVFPTPRKLKRGEIEHFQPTASGKPESAYYGSVRTVNVGKHLLPSFHEGIDIAAIRRDKKGMPEDEIYAIADGKIVYLNKIAGNSNYGKYVIIAHPTQDGEVFSLYAHLASIDERLRAGLQVSAGDRLGIMGNSASTGIQKQNAHLHLEIGLMLNSSFAQWYSKKKLKPYHGNYHGWNFIGIDPLLVYETYSTNSQFNFFDLIKSLPVAFEITIKTSVLPDFFKRYPTLWQNQSAFNKEAIVILSSEAGLPISGRNARDEELSLVKKAKWQILKVYPEVIGRNGARIIVERNGKWVLSEDGLQWLEILTCN